MTTKNTDVPWPFPKKETWDGTHIDPHTLRASTMFNVEYADVTHEQRQAAKEANVRDMYHNIPLGENE